MTRYIVKRYWKRDKTRNVLRLFVNGIVLHMEVYVQSHSKHIEHLIAHHIDAGGNGDDYQTMTANYGD